MASPSSASASNPARRALWSGLLLGFLLMVFVAAFVYVAYLFLSWGQTAIAEAPDLPALSLPRLVRPAAAGEAEAPGASLGLFRTAGRGQEETAPAAVGRTTILVMGVDARPGQAVARTDTIIVLTIDPQTGAAGMLSIPRDLKVHPTALNRDMKITSVYPNGEVIGFPGGGAALLMETVSELLGYPIDYYVRVNFDGFKQIVDLVGGIEVEVPTEIYDDKYPDDNYGYLPPWRIPAGLQHMDGETALKYARTRTYSNDYMRAGRQQQVIVAVKDKITQPGQMGALLPRLPGLAIAMANSVETDMPMEKVIALARLVDKMELENLTRVVIDPKMGTVVPNDPALGYILIPDLNKVRAAADAIFAGEPAGPSPEEAARQVIQAEAARIIVLNGTAEKGLATKIQATLVTNGFNVVTVGNADRADYAECWLVTHGDVAPATVEALLRWFNIPAERVRSDPPSDQVDITLIVGEDQSEEPAAG